MGINQIIFDAIIKYLMAYEDYCCDKDEIKRFLMIDNQDFRKRQEEAISIINKIMTAHGKQELRGIVTELARVEYGTRELEPLIRDHVVHALLSFLLGIYINENFLKSSGCHVKPFPWKLAGLLHDIGYPVQVARNILNPFTKKINKIKHDLGVEAPDVFLKVVPVGLDKLTGGTSSLDLIQSHLDKWELKIDANREYNDMVSSGRICHGIISSLSVLYVIDLMYQKYNPERKCQDICDQMGVTWDQSYFENDVIPACSAIFIHNLPSSRFKTARLNKKRAPLAFLLRLSDCLQDWDRPSADCLRGIPNDKFDIKITDGRIVFTVADKSSRDKIASDITSVFVSSDIEIR